MSKNGNGNGSEERKRERDRQVVGGISFYYVIRLGARNLFTLDIPYYVVDSEHFEERIVRIGNISSDRWERSWGRFVVVSGRVLEGIYKCGVEGVAQIWNLKLKFYKTKTEKLKRDIYKQYNPVFGLVWLVVLVLFDWFGFLRLGFGFTLVFVFEYLCLWLGSCVYSNKCQWGLHFGFGVCMGFVIVVKERQTKRIGAHWGGSITNCDERRVFGNCKRNETKFVLSFEDFCFGVCGAVSFQGQAAKVLYF